MAQLYNGTQGLFGLAVHVMVLISAFKSSTGQGVLCLCVPFYALYFVFSSSESDLLKWGYSAAVLTGLIGIMLN